MEGLGTFYNLHPDNSNNDLRCSLGPANLNGTRTGKMHVEVERYLICLCTNMKDKHASWWHNHGTKWRDPRLPLQQWHVLHGTSSC